MKPFSPLNVDRRGEERIEKEIEKRREEDRSLFFFSFFVVLYTSAPSGSFVSLIV